MKHPDSVHSVEYPKHDLLRWLEKVEVDDKVKYGFLKYIYIHHLNATRVKFNFVMLIIEIKCMLNGMQ